MQVVIRLHLASGEKSLKANPETALGRVGIIYTASKRRTQKVGKDD